MCYGLESLSLELRYFKIFRGMTVSEIQYVLFACTVEVIEVSNVVKQESNLTKTSLLDQVTDDNMKMI